MGITSVGPYNNSNNSTLYNNNLSNNRFTPTSIPPAVTEPWVRNPSWPACTANSGDNKIVGLYAVFPGDGSGNGGNFFAFTGSGNYTIDYGDGTSPIDYSGGTTAYYEINYQSAALSGTDAPVTLTDSGDLISRSNHGYSDGNKVQLYNIVSSSGITEAATYYVINATTNNFQISTSPSGSPVTFTNDGSATLLPYKIAIITITPQAGSQLTSANFFVKHNQERLQNQYSTGWLDITVAAPDLSSLTFSGSSTTVVLHLILESFVINEIGSITSFANLFQNCNNFRNFECNANTNSVTSMSSMFNSCYSLTSVPLFNTSNVTDMSSMFSSCYSLVSVPLFSTSNVTTMNSMFSSCNSLTSVPLFNTISVTSMSNMFNSCFSLTSVPLFSTSNVTSMNTMFNSCRSLVSVPLFNTISVTNMGSMFNTCRSLTSVPLFNTSSVTSMSSMFSSCFSLTSVPLFNTSSVTDMSSMFVNCSSLVSVPLFSTSNVTDMSSMFVGCSSLISVPLFSTSNVTTMNSMFSSCNSLTSVPLFNTSSVTSMSNMFNSCFSLTSVPLFNTSSVTSMNTMFNSCFSLTSVPLFNTSNVTNMSSMFLNCSSLTSVPLFNTSSVTNMNSMFNSCFSLTSVPNFNLNTVSSSSGFSSFVAICTSLTRILAFNFRFTFSVTGCKLSKVALDELFTKLSRITSTQTLAVTNNYGADTAISKTSCGTTAGSKTVTQANTSNLVIGQRVTGTGVDTGVAVTFQDTGDTVTRNNHGIDNGTIVYFSVISTTIGITTFTPYYVVNATTNTFQLASSSGGPALPLTNNGSGTMFYPSYITGINTNVSFTISAAASATGTVTLAARTLDTFPALVKGWAVTV